MSVTDTRDFRRASVEHSNKSIELVRASLDVGSTDARDVNMQLAQIHATLANSFAQLDTGNRLAFLEKIESHVNYLADVAEDGTADTFERDKLKKLYGVWKDPNPDNWRDFPYDN